MEDRRIKRELPRITIVITTYNQAAYLSEAIESALGQSHDNVEVIVVDDGSQDASEEVARKYDKVRYIKQHNQGVAKARNTGLDASSGEYIVFLDGDDRLRPDAVEVNLKKFELHPECMMVAGAATVIDRLGKPVAVDYDPPVEQDHYAKMLHYNYLRMPAMVMYRKSIFTLVGPFREDLAPADDWEMYLRIMRLYPVYCHGHPVAEYRLHGSNTSRKSALMLAKVHRVLRSQRKYVKDNRDLKAAYRTGHKILRRFHGEELVNCIRREVRDGRWRDVMLDVSVLARYYPLGLLKHLLRKLKASFTGTKEDEIKSAYDLPVEGNKR